jgi:hypothetical protein
MYAPVGYVDDDPEKLGTQLADLDVLGSSATLSTLVRQYHVDKIVVAITGRIGGDLFRALVDCRAMGCTIVRFPAFHAARTRQVPVEHVDMGWVLDAMGDFNDPFPFEAFIRRLMDIAGAAAGLVFLGMMYPFIALAVALDDGGPIFYKQTRLGKAGKWASSCGKHAWMSCRRLSIF